MAQDHTASSFKLGLEASSNSSFHVHSYLPGLLLKQAADISA